MIAPSTGMLDEMTAWSAEEQRKAREVGKTGRALRLGHLRAQLVRHRDRRSSIYPPGSTQRLLAESRERRILSQAAALGYAPEGQQVAGELIQHAAGLELVPGGE